MRARDIILGRKELVIHPVCHSEEFTYSKADEVIREINRIEPDFTEKGNTLFIENNGPKTLLFNDPRELERLFSSNDKLRDSRDMLLDFLA